MPDDPFSSAPTGTATSPGFAMRGVVESFYGPVWSAEQRLDLIRFIARHHMNFYGYSPKDDPYCRHAWDRSLPADRLLEVRKLAEVGDRSGVSVAYGLAPGISICHSDQHDRDRLTAKYKQVADVGVRHFLLLYDDIPGELQHPRDQVAYESLAPAHADLANFVRGFLDREVPDAALMVCPTVYCGRGDEPYLLQLGALLEERIDIFWTGRTVWSSEIDARDAKSFCARVGRPPLYWDNYPANDLFMSDQMHLGPYRGRDRDLHKYSRGILVNPMTQCECSKIPLATIGDYLWDPAGYDSEASWQRAIVEVVGARDAKAFQLFGDNVRSSCLEMAESPLLSAALERVRFASRFGPAEAERGAAVDLVRGFGRAADQLLGPETENAVLAAEVRPWILAFKDGANALLNALTTGRWPDTKPGRRPSVFSPLAIADLLPDAAVIGRWQSLVALPLVGEAS